MGSLISAVTPVYNGEQFIERCYWTLVNQTWTDWEWVVADDGSNDGTLDRLEAIAERDARVRVITYQPNRGRGFARTRTLEAARGDWVALWDADDLYMPERLARIDEARRAGFDYYSSPAVVMDQQMRFRGVRQPSARLHPLEHDLVIHAATAARTELLREIGYDPNLKTVGQIGEDAAVVFRLSICHRGFRDPKPMMINQIGHEVFLRKSIHSNSIQIRELARMRDEGVLPMSPVACRRLLRRQRRKLAMLRVLRCAPGLYVTAMRRRQRGAPSPEHALDEGTAAFVREVRDRFPVRSAAAAAGA